MSEEESSNNPFSLLINAVRVKVAGRVYFTLLYYFVLLVALAVFIISAYSIIAPVVRGEVVTSVETKFLPTFTYPVIFACLSPAITLGARAQNVDVDINGASNCPEDHAALIRGRVEIPTSRITCLPVATRGTPRSASNNATIHRLQSIFQSDECILINTDGSFQASQDSNAELLISFTQDQTITGVSLYGILGFFQQGTSPFNAQGNLTAQYFRAGFQNTLSAIGLQMDTIIDQRHAAFITIPSSVLDVTTEETTQIYSITSAVTTREHVGPSSPLTSPATDMLFYVSSFTSREITLRKRSFGEVWAMLGGALASALVIITWFFREEVVEDEAQQGTTEKVQVFRYKTVAEAKKEALALVQALKDGEHAETLEMTGAAGKVVLAA